MCSVKAEVCELKLTVDPIESECGGVDLALRAAKAEREDSGPPTPKKTTLALPKPAKQEKEEEEDVLACIALLFDQITLDDFEDSDDEGEYGEDESAPPSPRSKGFENKYCFYASSRLYYFDDLRRVYSEDGTLLYECSFDSQLEDLLSPSFFILGVPYWFDEGGLLSHDTDGTLIRVHTWLSAPDLLVLDNFLDQVSIPQVDVAVFEPNSNPGSFFGVESIPMTIPDPEFYTTPKSKTEVLTPNVSSRSLEQALQEGPKPLVWSPTSSTNKSPIVTTGGSRESSMGPSLFHESQPIMLESHPVVKKWQQDVECARQSEVTARPVRKPAKEERRRCPECNKLFRRPSSLDDHLNVHSGKKPHICPFEGCNTGFATKSNMKRHFLTHRVGDLERYRPGITPQEPCQPIPTKPGKAPRAPTATYNSKSYHNGRFRISA
ncbi:hypothetical protein OPQ81_000332 [Rhizoctonia solani]|nr:hypothetical protein OPQ81_000332 [Rhizoctonia solani]